MTGVGLTGKVRRGEWLTAAENHFEPLLRSVSFAMQVNIEPEDARRAAQALGYGYRKVLRSRKDAGYAATQANQAARRTLWLRPASLVVAMVGVGAERYSEGAYWPAFFDEAGVPPEIENERAFGDEFLSALERLGLPTFDHLDLKYVGPVLMHAGIPASCLPDLARLLIERRSGDSTHDARSFLQWALHPSAQSRMASVDAPVRHFLRDGGTFASDLVDRILELINFLEPVPNRSNEIVLEPSTTGLPRVLVDALVEGMRTRFVLKVPEASTRGVKRTPSVAYDHQAGSVVLELPEVDSPDGTTSWVITGSGAPIEVASASDWFDSVTAPAVSTTLSTPAARIEIENVPNRVKTQIELYDPRGSALYFDNSGKFLPSNRPLPPGLCWALFPLGRTLIDQDQQPIPANWDNGEPLGWSDWSAVQVDLTETSVIRCSNGLDSGSSRSVQHLETPTIDTGLPVPGLTTNRGDVVYSARPIVHLPSSNGITTEWTISVHSLDFKWDSAPVKMKVDDQAAEVNPFSTFSGSVLGTFAISVAAPGRQTTKATMTIAEGVDLHHEPTLRLINGDGLQTGRTSVRVPADLESSSENLDFTAATVRLSLKVTGSVRKIMFQIEPPHMAILADVPGAFSGWRTSVVQLMTESVREGRSIRIKLPGALEPTLELVSDDNKSGQVLRSEGRAKNAEFSFGLAKLAETVRTARRVRLYVVTPDTRVLVARVRPEVRANAVELSNAGLRLVDYQCRPGDSAAIYVKTAPWLGHLTCEVSAEGDVELPDVAGIAGDLVIDLAEDRGWGIAWPRWPGEDSLQVRRGGYRYSTDPPTRRLSQLLGEPRSGHRLLESTELKRVWLALDLLNEVVPKGDRAGVEQELQRILHASPGKSRDALTRLNLRPEEAERLLLRAGLTVDIEPVPAGVNPLPKPTNRPVPVPVPVAAQEPAPEPVVMDRDRIAEMRSAPGEWYLASVYPRHEAKVKATLTSRIVMNDLEDQIFEIVVPVPKAPSKPVSLVRKGKPESHAYAGYLLIRMEINNTTYGLVRNTPGVNSFKSNMGTWPMPLDLDEVFTILDLRDAPEERPAPQLVSGQPQPGAPQLVTVQPHTALALREGSSVLILAGPFATLPGIVIEVDADAGKVKVLVKIFGRETPAVMSFDQVGPAKQPA